MLRKPKTLSPDDRAAYAAFCESAPDIPVYFLPQYLDAIVGSQNWSAAMAVAENQVQAVWPYYFKQRLGLWYVTMPPLTKYAGPYLMPDFRTHRKAVELTKNLIKQLPPLAKWTQNATPLYTDLLAFKWYAPQFSLSPYITFRLSLSDNWPACISRTRRQQLRKTDDWLQLRHDITAADIHHFLNLTFRRQNKRIPFTLDTIQRHTTALNSCGRLMYFGAATHTGELASVACLTVYKNTAYYLIIADNPAFRPLNAGAWLMSRSVEYCFRFAEVHAVDFEGSMIESVASLLRSLGAKPCVYYNLHYNRLKI